MCTLLKSVALAFPQLRNSHLILQPSYPRDSVLCAKKDPESRKQMSDLVKGTADEMLKAQYAEPVWSER